MCRTCFKRVDQRNKGEYGHTAQTPLQTRDRVFGKAGLPGQLGLCQTGCNACLTEILAETDAVEGFVFMKTSLCLKDIHDYTVPDDLAEVMENVDFYVLNVYMCYVL